MQDVLIRATAADGNIRAYAVITTTLTEVARSRHSLAPTAAAALGRTMSAGLLLGATLKQDERITIKIAGNGPLGSVVAEADQQGRVRGYVEHPRVHLPLKNGKLDVGGAVGNNGFIHVIRDTGLKESYRGSAALVNGEIGDDITNYLYVSEQTPSTVGVGVLVAPSEAVIAAGGFFIQLLPQAPKDVIDLLEHNLYALPSLSGMIGEGCPPNQILEQAFTGMKVHFHGEFPVYFHCPCNRERAETILLSLGKEEMLSMINDGHAEMYCHFCGERYTFQRADLQQLYNTMNQAADEKDESIE